MIDAMNGDERPRAPRPYAGLSTESKSRLPTPRLTIIAIAVLAIGCDDVQKAPRIIEADGATYVACRGLVWVKSDGGGLFGGAEIYKVSFTDAAGLDHVLRGIRKVQVSDMPKTVPAPMPLYPSMTTSDGKPVVEGHDYSWPDGTRARLRKGKWEPVDVPNDACPAKLK